MIGEKNQVRDLTRLDVCGGSTDCASAVCGSTNTAPSRPHVGVALHRAPCAEIDERPDRVRVGRDRVDRAIMAHDQLALTEQHRSSRQRALEVGGGGALVRCRAWIRGRARRHDLRRGDRDSGDGEEADQHTFTLGPRSDRGNRDEPHVAVIRVRSAYVRVRMFSEIAAIYRASKKKRDINWFTEHVARPPAAAVVYALRNTRITPNQVTFGSAFLAAGACAMFVLLPGWLWGFAAALVFEASFVLDCVDGQLARVRKLASPLGHLLDFLMDELKAMLLLACVTVRLWRTAGDPWLLVIGLGALFCLAAGLMLTSFMRRPEYGAKPPTEDGQPAHRRRRGAGRSGWCSTASSGARASSCTTRSTCGCARSRTGSTCSSGPTPR